GLGVDRLCQRLRGAPSGSLLLNNPDVEIRLGLPRRRTSRAEEELGAIRRDEGVEIAVLPGEFGHLRLAPPASLKMRDHNNPELKFGSPLRKIERLAVRRKGGVQIHITRRNGSFTEDNRLRQGTSRAVGSR